MTRTTKLPNYFVEIARRLKRYFTRGSAHSSLPKTALSFVVGSVLTSYSLIDIFYNININSTILFKLPFYDFYSKSLVPFVLHPFLWTGWSPTSLYNALVVLSGIGASLWAKSEFQNEWKFLKHIFRVSVYKGPKIPTRETLRNPPELPKKRRFLSLIYFATIPFTLLVSYSLLGLLASTVWTSYGMYFVARDIKHLSKLMWSNILYTVEHISYTEKAWNKQHILKARIYHRAVSARVKVDRLVFERDPIWLLAPLNRNLEIFQDIAKIGSRIFANAIWIIFIAFLFNLLGR